MDQPRCTWRIGRIKDVIKGKDEKVRGARIVCITENGHTSVLRRPINKLIPLEMENDDVDELVQKDLVLTFVDDENVLCF